MIARHPATGQPIRILRTERQITSDHKTLVWVRDTFVPSHRWAQRWYAVVDTVDAATRVCMNRPCAAIYIPQISDAWVTQFPTLFHDDVSTILLCSSDVSNKLANRGCTWKHTILTDELSDTHPQIGGGHTPTTSADFILAVAHILRANRIVWNGPLEISTNPLFTTWKRACGAATDAIVRIPENANDSCIPRVWLIQQYYQPTQVRRARELLTALERNIACDWIDHIILMNEEIYTNLPESPKIVQHQLLQRMTYYDTLCTIQKYVPLGDYACFSNSDISFDETLRNIWHIGLREHRFCLALLRWEESTGALFGPRPDSQDSWILSRDCVDFEVTEVDFGFPYGKSGCDNALTVAMLRHRFVIANPAYSIRTTHHHASNVRTYDPRDILYRTHYMYVDPVRIQPLASSPAESDLPIRVAMEWVRRTRRTASFQRTILGIRDEDVREFCHAAAPWKFDSSLWTPPPSTSFVRHYAGGAFVNVSGSVWNCKNVLDGPMPPDRCLLPQTQSIHVPHLIATNAEQTMPISKWCLEYLPRALAIRDTLERARIHVPEFLVPRLDMIGAFLADCVWNSESNTIIVTPMMDNITYYSNNIWVSPATHSFITKEDVERLRMCLPPKPAADAATTRIVLCVDDNEKDIFSRTCAEYIATHALKPEWTVHYVSKHDTPTVRRKAFADANWILGSGSSLEWIWYAPKGATVVEFVPRGAATIDGTIAHLAGAAELRYIVCSAEPGKHIECAKDVNKAFQMYGFKEVLETLRLRGTVKTPQLIVPSGAALSGIHGHDGDTFREMIDIWEERKYATVERNETTPYCWWGGVGEILLYDRPTARWWTNPPPNCQMALFGNCAPPGPADYSRRQSVWSFWPRAPREVERIASEGHNRKGYMTRANESVFIGKIENGVQYTNRTGADWASAVSLFSMPIDSTGAPYPYTQDEYLTQLCNSRYGLCLRGFGPKCNREIEYFACGCVPIITPGVDMKNYLVPPVEGIHYFTASTPEDVQRIVRETKPERWALMSAAGREWWRSYASAEGMFRLTWARIEQCRPYLSVGIPHSFL